MAKKEEEKKTKVVVEKQYRMVDERKVQQREELGFKATGKKRGALVEMVREVKKEITVL